MLDDLLSTALIVCEKTQFQIISRLQVTVQNIFEGDNSQSTINQD